jgi:hypothetical protein
MGGSERGRVSERGKGKGQGEARDRSPPPRGEGDEEKAGTRAGGAGVPHMRENDSGEVAVTVWRCRDGESGNGRVTRA